MRIERFADHWGVFLDRAELERLIPNRSVAFPLQIGNINARGRIRIWRPSGGAPRNWSRLVTPILEQARAQLIANGRIIDRAAERRRIDEQKTGSFIVALFDGRVLRFHELRPAMKAIDEVRDADRDAFGGALIFRGGYRLGDGVIHAIDRRGLIQRPAIDSPPFRSAVTVANAMRLETYVKDPSEPLEAWLIAADTLEEAGRSTTARWARRNAERWARTAHVSTRVPAHRRRRHAR